MRTSRTTHWTWEAWALATFAVLCPHPADALEKYGRPLPPIGEVGAEGVAKTVPPEAEHWLRGYLLTAGFLSNPTFAARPDNTGRALFRYVAHADLDLYRNRVVLFTDMNFFTDRSASNAVNPSELDWIIGLAFRWGDAELSVYHERDMPLDRGGLVQRYTALQLRYEFEWVRRKPAPP